MASPTPYKDSRVETVRKVSVRLARYVEEHTTEEDAIRGIKILFLVVLCEYVALAAAASAGLAYLVVWLLGCDFFVPFCVSVLLGLYAVKRRLEYEGVTFSWGPISTIEDEKT